MSANNINEAARSVLADRTVSQQKGHPSASIDNVNIPQSRSVDNNLLIKLLKPREVASILGVSLAQVYRLAGNELPAVRFGGNTVRFRASDVETYINSRVIGGEYVRSNNG